jgi:uridylate kinase
MKNKIFIISLGGSLIAPPAGIDYEFLRSFRTLILSRLKKGEKFFIVTGGGATARDYIRAADRVVKTTDDDRDWLGIHATRLNAHLLRTLFRKVAHPAIIKDPSVRMRAGEKVIVAGGWKPGWSTDYVAAALARTYGVKTVINLSNIDYAYDKDPRKFKNANKIEHIDWRGFRKIVGSRWDPGANLPFDPVASRLAQKLGLKVVIVNGKNLSNLRNLLAGKKFRGTVIEG